MRQPLQLVIIGLLACLVLASALPGIFPPNNITTYRYYADVKTGTIEPKPFASQFVITGLLHVIPEVRDPNLKNAYNIVLNVTHAIRNGEIQHFEKILDNTIPIPDAAEALNDPFVVIFDDNGKVKSLMMNDREAGWSRNIKQSIASMLQLDLSSMQLETPMKPHGFLTKENTIYGECVVGYDVHRTADLEENHFTVTKIMEPMSCRNFVQHEFNSKESGGCLIESEEEMTAASRRVFQIENNGGNLLIRTLVAHGVINYFPWKAQSEAHYILANQTMEFESLMPMDSMPLPELEVNKMITVNDIAFKKSESLYAPHAGVDPTHGRHVVDLQVLITRLLGMLGEAVDYMDENNLEMTSPEFKHGQTINRILDTMTRMDLPSLEHVFNNIMDETAPRGSRITYLFLNMLPYVGTNATCLFIRNVVRKHKIEDEMATVLLTKLPYNIRVPSDSLLIEMEDLMRLGNDTSLQVRKAGILSFATMIYKTHRHYNYRTILDSALLNRYVQYYFDHMIHEPTFEMKMVFMHGMRNIEIGEVHKLLEPIIRGEQKISERPDHLRFHAMLINWRRARDVEYIHNLYWPILSNTESPLLLRLCAYAILIEQPPRMERLMNLYWFMVYEKNEHLYNFHYTTMKGLANTVNPCMTPMKEMARKILRFTRVRPVSGIKTSVWTLDSMNREFGFGDAMTMQVAADEYTGMPFAGSIEFTSLNKRRPVHDILFWLRIEGVDDLKNFAWNTTLERPIPMQEIQNVLRRASEDMPEQNPIHIEFAMMIQGRTVSVTYFDKIPEISVITGMIMTVTKINLGWQIINFDELYTMQVPNDLGLPSLLHNKIPRAMFIQASNEGSSPGPSQYNMIFRSIFNDWRHGYHSMEVYNPILDTWHAIRRVSAYDASLPSTMNIGINERTKSLKIHLPRLPLKQNSISGIRSYVKNYVMVMEAEHDILERYGGNSRQIELVTKGEEHRKNTTIMDFDSEGTGLRLSMYRYDCERVLPPKSRSEIYAQWVSKDVMNSWNDNAISAIMLLRENYLHGLISPELGTCGYLTRLEPSITYPTSSVDVTMRMSFEEPIAKKTSVLPAMKINLYGTLAAKAAATNVTTRSWTMNASIGSSQEYINNQLQIRIRRTTPGETDLKICIDGYKSYPTLEGDPLDRNFTKKHDVIGGLTMTMGESDNLTCVMKDGVSIRISGKIEMSEEQKEALEDEMVNGMCQKDIENPKYLYNESSIVPRTLGCLREAILRTTLRKSTYKVLYTNIPDSIIPLVHSIADDLRLSVSGELTYLPAHTEPGVIKVFAEYPLADESVNVNILTPTLEEKYTGIPEEEYEDYGLALENTRFTQNFLYDLKKNEIKFCVIYPEVLLNSDGAVMPFTVSDKWTLLIGDHIGHMFSVFVKRLEPKKLGLLMSVRNHTIEIIPSATVPTVNVDGEVIDHVNGVSVPEGSLYAIRTSWSQNRLIIQSMYTSFSLEWTERSVALVLQVKLQGRVTGLCGHLDGTHADRMPKVYTFEN